MKILVDISNTPHVLLFKPIISELEKKGHNIKVIARQHAQIEELLKLHNIKYVSIGKHYGKNLIKKLLSAFIRVIKIVVYIRKENPNLCISHQSPYIIYAGFLNKKKTIYIFDNDKAKMQNNLTFPLATKIICPEIINLKNKKTIKYPGVKEALYMKKTKLNKISKSINKKKILIRTEISSAAYHKGKPLFSLAKKLVEQGYEVIVSPRTQKEEKEYSKIKGITVINKPVNGEKLIQGVDLVIGGGGTMNREAVVLGKPVISTYSGELLEVDKYFIENNLMSHSINPSLELIKKIINKTSKNTNFLKQGRKAMEIIIREIEKM